MMKAVVLKGERELAVEDVPLPHIPGAGPDEVERVEIAACGICGSDLRYYKGDNPWAIQTLGRNMENPTDIIIGHEAGGFLEGEEGGRLVFPWTFKGCMECELCLTGREHLCADTEHIGHGAGWGEMDYYPGTMAEYCELWADRVYPVSEELSPKEVALIEPTAVSVHAVERAELESGADVGLIGLGTVGLLIAQVARSYGANDLFGYDRRELPLEKAGELGVDYPLDVSERGPVEVTEEQSVEGLDVVFDTVGTGETIEAGLSLLSPDGVLVQLAGPVGEIEFPYMHLSGERGLTTSANFNYFDLQAAIKLVEKGRVQTEPLITHEFDIDQAEQAFQVALRKEEHEALKVIVHP